MATTQTPWTPAEVTAKRRYLTALNDIYATVLDDSTAGQIAFSDAVADRDAAAADLAALGITATPYGFYTLSGELRRG